MEDFCLENIDLDVEVVVRTIHDLLKETVDGEPEFVTAKRMFNEILVQHRIINRRAEIPPEIIIPDGAQQIDYESLANKIVYKTSMYCDAEKSYLTFTDSDAVINHTAFEMSHENIQTIKTNLYEGLGLIRDWCLDFSKQIDPVLKRRSANSRAHSPTLPNGDVE